MPEPGPQKNIDIDAEKLQLEKLKAETDRSLQEKRLDLEIEKLKLDREKFVFEQSKTEKTERFINKNVGTVITAIVSLTAVIVSIGQVWVTKISKDRELEITRENKKYETEALDKQKDKELTLVEVQKKRDWNLSVANFVLNNRKALFHGTDEEKRTYAKIIPTIFPVEVSDSLLERLTVSSTPQSKRIWQDARITLPAIIPLINAAKETDEISSVLTKGEDGYLNLLVTDSSGRSIRNLRIAIGEGGSAAMTDDRGRARIKLPPAIKPGEWVTLTILKSPSSIDWVIISPWNNKINIPPFDGSGSVSIVVARKGDKEILSKGRGAKFLKRLKENVQFPVKEK